ncbi:MAG TPA: TerB family tellurite resistance protein [Bacteroidetes bacterium]|nr:TerB family tellurite resistance protein [Bacteroidota bacterium]
MLKRLQFLFAPQVPEASSDTGARDLSLAICVLLLEAAQADDVFTPEERDYVIRTLKERYELNDEEAETLMEHASSERENSVDLWQFTNRLNERMNRDEKQEVLSEVWEVIYADGKLDAHEDYLAHRLAALLNLSHGDFIAAKLEAQDRLRGGAPPV